MQQEEYTTKSTPGQVGEVRVFRVTRSQRQSLPTSRSVTDPGKKSKEDFLPVELASGDCAVVVAETLEAYGKNLEKSMLKTYYYEDGVLSRFDSLREMRERTAKAETQWIGKGKVVVWDNVRKRPSASG